MIYIGRYDELSPGRGYETMKRNFCSVPYEGQDKIVEYLKKGDERMASFQTPSDVFTGKNIPGCKLCLTDGKYTWWNTLAYYVEHYNLRLPTEFENHILTQ